MNRRLIRTNAFIRALRRFLKKHPQFDLEIEETLDQLSRDAFAPGLKTHKLRGDLDGTWACSAGYDLRILFQFVQDNEEEAILLLAIGTHDEVY